MQKLFLLKNEFCTMRMRNIQPHTATRINRQQQTATHLCLHSCWHCFCTNCETQQHTATHCNTLQYAATHCNTLQLTTPHIFWHSCVHYYSLCNPLHSHSWRAKQLCVHICISEFVRLFTAYVGLFSQHKELFLWSLQWCMCTHAKTYTLTHSRTTHKFEPAP